MIARNHHDLAYPAALDFDEETMLRRTQEWLTLMRCAEIKQVEGSPRLRC